MSELSGDKAPVPYNEDLGAYCGQEGERRGGGGRGAILVHAGRGTTNAIFILREISEKYREKGRDLHMVFIDLEKAYDRVPREELWRCLREKMVPEKYARLIKEMYRDVNTRVRSGVGTTKGFEVKVGLHQGSALSPFLFNIVFDMLTRGVRRCVPWSMMFCAERRAGKLNDCWRSGGWRWRAEE